MDDDWRKLDDAVFDLYQVDEADRIIVRDGFYQASWAWSAGRRTSVEIAETESDLMAYARIFLSIIDTWLSARNRRRMRAEIFDLPRRSPLRVIRFVLEDCPGPSIVEILKPDGELSDLLAQIGNRLRVRLAHALVGERELRIHGHNEVVIIKPTARRHWMGVLALEDADAVVAESIRETNVGAAE